MNFECHKKSVKSQKLSKLFTKVFEPSDKNGKEKFRNVVSKAENLTVNQQSTR